MGSILVVEDEAIIALDIRFILREIGVEKVYLVDNGEDAIKIVNLNSIDLIVMDINILGSIDGIETAKIIQKTHKMPIIYCSAYSDRETLKRTKSTTNSFFLEKPFEEEQLIEIVREKFPSMEKRAVS